MVRRRRPLPALVLALALVTAGCAGIFGQQTTPVTPVPTVEQPAPGVPAPDQAGQVQVDTERLLAANQRVRANSTYTLVRTATIRGPEGSLRIERTRLEGADGAALERLNITGSDDLSAVVDNGTLWTNGSITWTRTRLSNRRTVTSRLLEESTDPYGYGDELAKHVLRAAQFDVEERERGVTLRSVRNFSMGLPLVPLAAGPAENASATVAVDDAGLVRSLNLTYDADFGDDRVSVTIRQRVRAQNATAVVRPAWVPTTEDDAVARERGPTDHPDADIGSDIT